MIFIIEDNVTSLLSALYFAFIKNIFPSEVFAEKYYQPRLDEETLKIENNLSGAQKVKDALIKYGEDYIELQSINPYYPPRRFEGKDITAVHILGVVVESRRKFL